jgi:hypothetical protein
MLGRRASRKRNGTSRHANGITMNKTTQTIESAASGATICLQDIHNPAQLFRFLA